MSYVVEGLVRFPPAAVADITKFTAEFAEVELPVVRSSDLGLAGAWTIADAEGSKLLHLYGPIDGLADLTASARSIAKLPPDHPYHELYTWITGTSIRYSRTIRPLIDPVDRGWWERRTTAPSAEPYFVATCRYGLTGEHTFRAALSTALAAIDATDGVSVALAYDTLFGDHGCTRVIGTAATLESFTGTVDEHTRVSAAYRDPWTTVPATPTPYSPLR
ncbi:hypothetical protein [Actinomadura sp. 7K507]|uniref:hypothetical protein n=1 Tax=Actinomadura sp. 7K507 TaxID=2530365 RepID=UPI001044C92F|nr:hypothetical protein [Actinomadura sp. 7K507]TDC92986.1 hypothetical protein E1285_10765 [Actinomadura sp. 7K507]